jgi:hypothetical protein
MLRPAVWNELQDRQCTEQVIKGRSGADYCIQTSNLYYIILTKCVIRLHYPACKAQPHYYIEICGLSALNNIFSKLSHKQHDFGKMATEHKVCITPFLKTFFWSFLVLQRIQREIAINDQRNSDYHHMEWRLGRCVGRVVGAWRCLGVGFGWRGGGGQVHVGICNLS